MCVGLARLLAELGLVDRGRGFDAGLALARSRGLAPKFDRFQQARGQDFWVEGVVNTKKFRGGCSKRRRRTKRATARSMRCVCLG